jgi:hypothetical protein
LQLIERRAIEFFDADPTLAGRVWDVGFLGHKTRDNPDPIPLSDEQRQALLSRAEQQLIEEGAIDAPRP